MKDYSKFLVYEDLIYFQPTLAKEIGLNEAILLQKIHGWLQCKPHDAEGRNWIYNTYKSWQEQLSFWSEDTIKRTLNKLVDSGIVIRDNFNKSPLDRTYWYSINYEKLDELCGCNMQLSISANCTNASGQLASSNTNDYYNDYYKENNISKDILKEKTNFTSKNCVRPRGLNRFVKPSLEEIKKYCKERNNNVDAQKFFDYYEVAGWKDSSGKPVKNWKQKMIANWEKEKKEETPKPKTKEELREEYAKMGYFYE